MKYLRELFIPPCAEIIARRELDEAKRRLLEAYTAREYADSMCAYREAQIKRLTAYLGAP
jgi:hypothetical protein